MTSRIKDFAAKSAMKASAFGALVAARANYLVMSDAFDDAETVAENLQDQLYDLAKVLFPLAVVICGVAMFFTRDQKKFETEKHILIGCCLAFALLVLVSKGNLVETIEGLFGSGS
ncbi:MAG: TrbC/VirB2 family protein [Treponema sp.]|nr:TrbC/VirB2 family protein [Treponema sp.]